MEPLRNGLLSLIPCDWFTDRANSTVWVAIYTSLFLASTDFDRVARDFFGTSHEPQPRPKYPVAVCCGQLHGLNVPSFGFAVVTNPKSGESSLRVKCDMRALEETNYVLLVTPLKIDGDSRNYLEARKQLDASAGLLCIHTGVNFMRDLAAEGEVTAHDGQFTSAWQGYVTPATSQGPFLAAELGAARLEAKDAIRSLPDAKQDRITLALQLMNQGMRQENGFLHYWTALEIVGGNANQIRGRLRRIYNLKSHKEGGEATRFNVIAKWRHQYVHKGIVPPLTPDVERYLQLMFVDLLRDELSLASHRYLSDLQNAVGYDLSPIGLADNRTGPSSKKRNRQRV